MGDTALTNATDENGNAAAYESRLSSESRCSSVNQASIETGVLTVAKSRLCGEVRVSGAKNSALRLLAASLLTDDTIELRNYPAGLLDARVHVEMLECLGKTCEVGPDTIAIRENRPLEVQLKYTGRSIRNTLLILGALVGRFGRGAVPLPGGCEIGERKYDLHVHVLQSLGARVWEDQGMLMAEAEGGLRGTDIHLALRSTGATENGILAGCLAQGTTRLWNPHVRPEILDLIAMLREMGARIEVRGQESILIQGVPQLGSAKHWVIADGIESLTWLIASVITNGDIEIVGFPFDQLEVPLIHLRESGARFYRSEDRLIARGGVCYPLDVSTGPYPGINSDFQPLLAVYGAHAKGKTRITDLRFPGRYGYIGELTKMGLRAAVNDGLLEINGGAPLQGATVRALDLRAGVALVLAGLTAEGTTYLLDSWQVERGYDQFVPKLRALDGQVYPAVGVPKTRGWHE